MRLVLDSGVQLESNLATVTVWRPTGVHFLVA